VANWRWRRGKEGRQPGIGGGRRGKDSRLRRAALCPWSVGRRESSAPPPPPPAGAPPSNSYRCGPSCLRGLLHFPAGAATSTSWPAQPPPPPGRRSCPPNSTPVIVDFYKKNWLKLLNLISVEGTKLSSRSSELCWSHLCGFNFGAGRDVLGLKAWSRLVLGT
jgi:hypothetical protein